MNPETNHVGQAEGQPLLLSNFQHNVITLGAVGQTVERSSNQIGNMYGHDMTQQQAYEDATLLKAFVEANTSSLKLKGEFDLFILSLGAATINVHCASGQVLVSPASNFARTSSVVSTLIKNRLKQDPSLANPFELRLLEFDSPSLICLVEAFKLWDGSSSKLTGDVLQLTESNVIPLCRISHFLDIPCIFEQTIEAICSSVDSANAVPLLILGEELESSALCNEALRIMMADIANVSESEYWVDVPFILKQKM